MRDQVLRRLLRNALTLSVSAPLASLGACGGRAVDDGAGAADGATADGSSTDVGTADTGSDAGPSCAGQSCGGGCAVGCTLTAACVDGVLSCGCACTPQLDASVIDVVQPDATDPCHPSTTQCPYYLPYSCLDAAVPDASTPTTQECAALCRFPGNGSGWCNLGTDPAGQAAVECYANCGVGRRTELGTPPRRRGSPVGRYLAAAARLEAGSVHAFRRLRCELEEHHAPRRLRTAALRAERDEVRHARDTAALAIANGVTPRMPRDRLRPRRSLRAIAVENAVEGCVRETYGALVALFQSETAKDRAVARLMRGVAADELRHAALSWRIARWVEPRLSTATRARVERARNAAVMELRAELTREPPPALADRVGLPAAAMAGRLLDAMLAQIDAELA